MVAHPLLTVRDWPEPLGKNPEGDLVVTTFHGAQRPSGPLAEVLNRHEEKLHPGDRRVLNAYMDLDMDTFSRELARRVIEILKEAKPDLRIRYLEFDAQRAILDMNRADPVDARRKLWAPEHEEVWNDLGGIHTELMEAFHEAVPPNAFDLALDVHTMYPFSPILDHHQISAGQQTVYEQRGQLQKYINDYRFARERGGVQRNWDFMTNNGVREYSNMNWVASAPGGLSNAGIQVVQNFPYNFGIKDLTGKRLMELTRRKGLTFDAPKNLFVTDRSVYKDYLPEQLDKQELEAIAQALAQSYLKVHAKA